MRGVKVIGRPAAAGGTATTPQDAPRNDPFPLDAAGRPMMARPAEIGWETTPDHAAVAIGEPPATGIENRAAAWLARHQLSATALVAAEQARHLQGEGLTADHDDQYRNGELVAAAIAYAQVHRWAPERKGSSDATAAGWPTSLVCQWKPSTPVRDLVKAAGLLLAEIDRLTRERPEAGYWESEAARLGESGEDPTRAQREAAWWATMADYHDSEGRCDREDCYHCNSRYWSDWAFPPDCSMPAARSENGLNRPRATPGWETVPNG